MTPEFYESVGGLEGCRRLSNAFYSRVVRDPVLRPLFPSVHCAIEALTTYLAQFLGGPCVYSPGRWYLSLREAHLRFRIGPAERDAWLRNMQEAIGETGWSEPVRAHLMQFFDRAADYLTGGGSGPLEGPLERHWEQQLALEHAMEAVRAGRTPDLENLKPCFERDPMACLGLLGAMIDAGMVEAVRRHVEERPQLARESYVRGRTLLHNAAIAGNVELARFLLGLGADPNGATGHSPLYEVANCTRAETAGEVVRLLAQAGARVNAPDGVQRTTPLHMAARRGNVRVAEALLDCGAGLNVRDRRGDTPLERARNCRKKEMADFLLSRGAAE